MSKTTANKEKINQLLNKGVETIEVKASLEKRLLGGETLRVKFGVDPTSPDLHLGHAVGLFKLRQWQELGHKVIFLIGDFTASIGDPSGRSEARPMLSPKQIEENWQTYKEQASKILDINNVEVRRNHEWYGGWSLAQLLELYSKFTVSRVLERDDFTKRMQTGGELSMLELAYPMLQGYDSYALHADVELGGSDQLFNMLMGRKVQKRLGQSPQDVMAVSLLEGTDGVKKMSKSAGNYIGLQETPVNMLGKLMRVPDQLISKYLTLLTSIPEEQISKYQHQIAEGSINPKDVKLLMATEVTSLIYGLSAAKQAAQEFTRVHTHGATPQDMPEFLVAEARIKIIDLLVNSGLASSKSEARRLLEQKAVRVNNNTVTDTDFELEVSDEVAILNVGPVRHVLIKRRI